MHRTYVGVSSCHPRVLVSHEIGQSVDVNPCLTVPGCKAMSQVVKPEISEPGLFCSLLKGPLDDPLIMRGSGASSILDHNYPKQLPYKIDSQLNIRIKYVCEIA